MTVHELEVPMWRGKPPLTANQRLHWRAKAERNATVRDAVTLRAKQAKIPPCEHITVVLHYSTGDMRRRDADNLVATLKPAIDGIVRAGVIPDDVPEHVTWHAPVIHNGPGKRRLWIEVRIE